MKLPAFEYACPTTISEAVALLAAHDGEAKPLAGGQSLVPMLAFRVASPSLLIDLRRLTELREIRIADDGGDTPGPSNLPRLGAATSVMKNEALGHGLAGMRDRVGLYGGTLAAGPCAGGGFEVAARLPVPAPVSMTGGTA